MFDFEGIKIEWLGHASFRISTDKVTIYIDPYNLKKGERKADIILITHEHYDHCSPAGPAAPASIEEKGADSFSNEIVNRSSAEYAHQEIEEEAFNLHVFIFDESEKQKHIRCNENLCDPATPQYVLFRQCVV